MTRCQALQLHEPLYWGGEQSLPKDYFGKDWCPRHWCNDDLHREGLGDDVYFVSPDTDTVLAVTVYIYSVFCACIVCLHLMHAYAYVFLHDGLIFSAHRWHQLSSLVRLIYQTAILFVQVFPKLSVTLTHSPRCELNHLWKG